jgi:methyl-accepting chemotaxis protein
VIQKWRDECTFSGLSIQPDAPKMRAPALLATTIMETVIDAPAGRRLTLGRRFALGFSILLAMLFAVALTSQSLMATMNRQVQGIVEVNDRRIALAAALDDQVKDVAISLRTLILLTDVREVDRQMLALDRAQKQSLVIEASLREALSRGPAEPAESELLEAVAEVHAAAAPLVGQAARLGADGATPEAGSLLMKRVLPIERRWRDGIARLVELERRLNAQAYERAQASHRTAVAVLVGVSLAAVAAGALLAWALTRSVLVPVAQAIRVAERVSEGDLTTAIEVHRSDELGRLLLAVRTMQQRLRGLVGEIDQSAESISTATGEIAVGNVDLSRRTEEQAASLQKTVSSMDLLTAAVRSNADSLRRADELAGLAARTAAQGGEVIARVRRTMAEISTHSRRIGDIIAVIDDLAFRTNILALNAAVEASRAGEAGRGFAVVASEVRNLAKGSAEAASQIRALILASSTGVASGEALVGDASVTMSAIVESVGRVTQLMSEVAESTLAQSDGIARVGDEVRRLDGMTQQNAALVEQSAAATESLLGQARRLTGSVGAFQLADAARPA